MSKSLATLFPSLGFVGAGNMAAAILRGVAGKRLIPPTACFAFDILPDKSAELARELGILAVASLDELPLKCETIVLATKPQDLMPVLDALAPRITSRHRMVSIAAGVRCARIESTLPSGTRVVRVMPNTPALVGEGAAGVAPGANATDADVEAVCALFNSVGVAVRVREEDLDAVTALSGSGPAYVFRFMEIFQSAAEEMGLSADLARRLTLQTFVGAAKLAAESSDAPAELRKKVTSKGGTTAAALDVMERRDLETFLKEALRAARDRSIELSK